MNETPVSLWALLASAGGSISALSFRPYKTMGRYEIALAVTMSFTFGIFVGPVAADLFWRWVFGKSEIDIHFLGGAMWTMSAGAHFLIPVLIRRVGAFIGTYQPQTEEKP